ncbi:PhoPQ-activated pathogenicity-related family protein [Fimbriiglobus ruber]|uniref:PhoP/Q-regulated protein PqaA n=1 Tax=Fimbriiglobus ruber TaxID=1908690 RepID=A0A225DEB3_9BACT|nr:PhoPQ-activated protein PqaA family protein [Fimbriiglobus ruber]OWK37984.1 PhoP/Q-regulated protein PqaA [Fimbriiglobus ruber]
MHIRLRPLAVATFFALVAVAAPAPAQQVMPAAPPDLGVYVKKADDSFSWKLVDKTETPTGTLYNLEIISQTWQGIKWDHELQIALPKGGRPTETMLLWNQGGKSGPSSKLLTMLLAEKIKAPVAFLYGVPKQPLFGGKKEDALIAETFVRYLETKDSSWPLLFPMVKSVVKSMDAIQAFAKEEWKFEVGHFVVTGASKRGWTSWLTAATGDTRVKAIAPLVIDTLNMPAQMVNQVAAFGKPSEMIHDYVERKLTPIPNTPEAKKLWAMIDPWVYRAHLTVPKMIINGANDPYWPLDALNSYWADLPGEKHVLYVPNAGHDLREMESDGKKQLFPMRAVNTMSAFAREQVFGKPLPKLTWTYKDSTLEVDSAPAAKVVRLWQVDSDTKDFRPQHWSAIKEVAAPAAKTAFEFAAPAKGFRAVLGEAEYEVDGLTFTLSTQVRILEAKK